MPTETKKYKADDLEAFCRDFEQSIASADNGYVFIMTTENIDFCKASKEAYESDAKKEKLFRQGLEIRIFDEKSERKWFRTGIDKAFSFRRVTDDEETEKDRLHWWNESQYLDIDTDRTKKERDNGKLDKGEVYATGGGKYPLPIEEYNDTKIRIRNYLGEDDDTGELYVKDWRLVGFGEWEDSAKGGGV